MEQAPKDYDYYTTTYRWDLCRWAGRTHKVPENISREINVGKSAQTNGTVRRCIGSMQRGTRGVYTPSTLYQDSYIPHMAFTRDIGPSFSLRCPEGAPPPDAAKPELLRPSTEYGQRYIPPRAEPFLTSEFVDRCSTTKTRSRAIGDGPSVPRWSTTYRRHYCEKAADLSTSRAVTFHTHTGLR
jgi:hypothetical protein